MAYYYVDDVDASLVVVRVLQACSKYFAVPTVADVEELSRKLDNLETLYRMWTEDRVDDSYQSEVYKRICEMFAENVFRTAVSSREDDDEISAEMMWQWRQLNPVYRVFAAFLRLNAFDEEKLAPYADGTFVEALVRRLHHSCVEAERECAKRILFRLFETVSYSRGYIVRGTVGSLADRSNGNALIGDGGGSGITELLELFDLSMCHQLVDSSTIIEVLSPLMVCNVDGLLCHYAGRLHECLVTAATHVAVLPTRFVDYAIDHWPATEDDDVPLACRTLAALYFDDAFGPERRRRVRGRLVDLVAGRLRRAAADGDTSSVAACRAYVDFVRRLIDDDRDDDDREDVERAAGALMAVHRTHRDYYCVHHTDRLLRRLVSGDGRRRPVRDACRLTVVEVLAEDRLRTMTENLLVDSSF